jgi:hypothetical protein
MNGQGWGDESVRGMEEIVGVGMSGGRGGWGKGCDGDRKGMVSLVG